MVAKIGIKNLEILRTNEAEKGQKVKNSPLHSKFTGFYMKKRQCIQPIRTLSLEPAAKFRELVKNLILQNSKSTIE